MNTNPSLSDIESILNLSYKTINLHLNDHLTFEQNETFILLKIRNNVDLSDKKNLDRLLIHIGCVIENIKIASNYLGYEIQLTHLVELSQSHLSFDINSDLSILKINFLKLKKCPIDNLKYHYLYQAEEVKPLNTNKNISSKFQFELQAMENELFKITFKNNEIKKIRQTISVKDKDKKSKLTQFLDLKSKFLSLFKNRILSCALVFYDNRSLESLFKLGELIQKVYFLCKKYGISIQSHEILGDFNSSQLINETQNVTNSNFKTSILNNYFCFTFEMKEDSKIDLKKHNIHQISVIKIDNENFKKTHFVYEEAFRRNIGILNLSEQMTLKNKTIALPGLGGAGGQHLITLARMGVGGFHIADNDYYELKNFNRQYGATLNSINQHKVKVMTDSVLNINPDIRLKSWVAFIDKSNVEDFLSGCDLVIDCVDAFNIEARRLIFNKAKEMNIPVITAGPIGYSCALLTFLPNSISFDDYIDYHEEDSNDLNFLRFIFGLTPRPYHLKYLDTKSVNSFDKSGPSISTSIALCAGFAGVEALKVLLNKGVIKAAPHFHYYDPFLMKFKIGYNLFGNRNPTQKLLLKIAKKSKGLQFLQEGV